MICGVIIKWAFEALFHGAVNLSYQYIHIRHIVNTFLINI